jgi:hypothetical protein
MKIFFLNHFNRIKKKFFSNKSYSTIKSYIYDKINKLIFFIVMNIETYSTGD